MNPNNLIRPPVLPNNNNANPPAGGITPEMERAISEAVRRMCLAECASIVPALVNPRENSFTDQGIDSAHQGNLQDLDKIPDVVRCLKDFSGDPKEFASWKKSVDRVMTLYDSLKGTAKYFGILNVVRNKIVGNADTALESYNTPLNWEAISECLTTHYADKRDVGTLEYQMSTLIQGSNTVQQFYQEVYSHLTLILNKVACMKIGTEALQLLTKTYRDKALDTFVRGLRGDLSKLLGMREPTDLPQALNLCLKMENQNYRTYHANNSQKSVPPSLPKRNTQTQAQQTQFYPHLAHFPQNFQRPQILPRQQTFNNYRNQHISAPAPRQYPPNNFTTNPQYSFPPPRPFQPKPPVPMDVDRSMQTRVINYANRPQENRQTIRRIAPISNQVHHPPQKLQRINQIEGGNADDDLEEIAEYQSEMNGQDNELQPLNEYLQDYSNADPDENNEQNFSDISFLD